MHAIVVIPSLIFVLLLIAIVYFWIKEDTKARQSIDVISNINSKYRYRGKIIPVTQIEIIPKVQDGFLNLEEVTRLFTYEKEANFYWIEYRFENNTDEDINFVLKRTIVCIDGVEIECDLSLLLEFVPEYLAPPYGIRYFNTKSFNNYVLGTKGQKTFRFESRFALENRNNFKSSDFIKIEIELNKFEDNVNQFVQFEKLVFIQNFEKIAQASIYAVDEQIKWED